MNYTIDRIEAGCAVCEAEDRTMLEIPLEELPNGAAPGDILVLDASGWAVDRAATEAAAVRIRRKMDSLWG